MKALHPRHYQIERERGETGSQFEADFIGQINTRDPKYTEAWKKAFQEELEEYRRGEWQAGEPAPTDGALRFRKAMELARKFQPYQPPHGPTNPNKPFGRDIRLEVIKLFEKFVFKKKATPEERKRFQFFTGADQFKDERGNKNNSPIDRHGVDAWLEYADENGKIYIATFDLTRKEAEEKIEPYKTHRKDILVRKQELHDPHLDPEKYEAAIEQFAKQGLQKMLVREIQEKKIVL